MDLLFTSYKNKLILSFIIIATIPMLIIGISMNYRIKNDIVEETKQVKMDVMEHEIEKMELWFKDKEQILKSIAKNYPLLHDMMGDSDKFFLVSNYLKSHANSQEEFMNVYITMINGEQYNSQLAELNIDTTLRNWFINAYLANDLVWTQPYKDILTGEIVVTISMPLTDDEGNIDGVLGADISLNKLISKFRSMNVHEKSTTYVINNRGNIIKVQGTDILNIENNKSFTKGYDIQISDFLNDIKKKNIGKLNLILDKEYFGIYGTISSLDWKIVSIVETENLFSSLAHLRKFIIITTIISMALIVMASIFFSSVFSKSLDKLKKGTVEIQKGNYDYRIEIDRNDEFGHLSTAFNDMCSNLKRTYAKLMETTTELEENNRQLYQMNLEIDASYEQLKATTDQLNESEAKYRSLIENMHDLVWVLDTDYKIVFVNDHIKKMLGYNRDDVIGKHVHELLSILGDIVFSDEFDEIMEYDLRNFLTSFISKNNETIIVEVNTERIYEQGKLIGIQGVARDVTKRILMEKEILKRNKELSIINSISGTLNSIMDVNSLVQRVAKDICVMMDVSLCTIRLLNDDNNLELIGCDGKLSHMITDKYINIDGDIIGQSVKTGEVFEMAIEDTEYITHFNKKVLESEEANYSSVFPLKARNKVIGVLIVSSKDRLDDSHKNILSSLSNQLTIKIDNLKLYENLKNNYMKTIRTLAAAVEAKDKYTEGHSFRVSKYAVKIAERYGLPQDKIEEVEVAGILHDIGKIGIRDHILTKPGNLTDEEYNEIKQHPTIGSKILRDVNLSSFIMDSIKYHHKRYDLKGYPSDESLDELPIGANIIGVADAFDAMTSRRSYREPMSFKNALEELIAKRGTQFHPEVVDIMVNIYNESSEYFKEVAVAYDKKGR